jgi:hypothetical protein
VRVAVQKTPVVVTQMITQIAQHAADGVGVVIVAGPVVIDRVPPRPVRMPF